MAYFIENIAEVHFGVVTDIGRTLFIAKDEVMRFQKDEENVHMFVY